MCIRDSVSSEKMQRLWAKILSNEIENVGSFSLRAIETLKNMNQHEASLFQQMAHFVLTDSSGIKFLLSTDNDLGVNVNEKYEMCIRDRSGADGKKMSHGKGNRSGRNQGS